MVYCTHSDVFTTKYIKGNLIPGNIRASISENKNNSVLFPHHLDCVLQSKVKGLACVCGLSQPAQVSDCPGHTQTQM